MFTNNFFYDNSQLNYGKHLTKNATLKEGDKKILGRIIDSVVKMKRRHVTEELESVNLYRVVGLIVALSLVVLAFEWKSYESEDIVTLGRVETTTDEVLDVPLTKQPQPPAPKKMAVSIMEIPDVEEIEEEIEIDFDIETNEDEIFKEVIYENIEEEIEEEKADEIFVIVEESPHPKGGLAEFYRYISEEIKYPGQALRTGIQGKVFVEFVVNKDGSLTDFKVVKGIGMGCDEEAIRVIKSAPAWAPGKQRGKEVRVKMIIPVHFVIQK